MAHCPAIDNPDSSWPPFCPSIVPVYIFVVLFGSALIAHIVQGVLYRKWYSLVIIVSAGMQTASFVFKILSIHNVTSKGLYSGWFILTLVAPVWVNAYVYMVMGRMVFNFLPGAHVYKIKAWHLGMIFVLLDTVAFFIQTGGLAMVGSGKTLSGQLRGIHIYMLGIGFQELCIIGFLVVAIRFHKHLKERPFSVDNRRALVLLYVEYAVVSLITVRILFRLGEYGHGLNSGVALKEVYEYIFDSTLMWIAIVSFNVVHPGRIMPGKDSEWPGRKQRKALKRQGQAPYAAGYEPMRSKDRSAPSNMEMGSLTADQGA